jgi:hypothetical protein
VALDKKMAEYGPIAHQQTYSVLRTLHALHGSDIYFHALDYMDTATESLTLGAIRELWALVGGKRYVAR